MAPESSRRLARSFGLRVPHLASVALIAMTFCCESSPGHLSKRCKEISFPSPTSIPPVHNEAWQAAAVLPLACDCQVNLTVQDLLDRPTPSWDLPHETHYRNVSVDICLLTLTGTYVPSRLQRTRVQVDNAYVDLEIDRWSILAAEGRSLDQNCCHFPVGSPQWELHIAVQIPSTASSMSPSTLPTLRYGQKFHQLFSRFSTHVSGVSK